MRVLLAPDGFGSTLTAAEAASAMAAGWSAARPGDVMTLAPQSDGGPGFVDVLAGCGDVREVTVAGPLEQPVRARWLLAEGPTAYIEAAQACGLHLLPGAPTAATALAATSRGLGELIADALATGATELVIGLGGSACTDGGRGMVEALGGLPRYSQLLGEIGLIAASDVGNPLLGPDGAAAVYGPQKGADPLAVAALEARLALWAAELAAVSGINVAQLPGAGAAGGVGAALLAAGGRVRPGATVVGELTGRRDVMSVSDLVVTGEGRLDSQTLQGKVVARLASEAHRAGAKVVVLAGQVPPGEAEALRRGLGASAVYSLADFAGTVEAAMAGASTQLAALAMAVAREWDE